MITFAYPTPMPPVPGFAKSLLNKYEIAVAMQNAYAIVRACEPGRDPEDNAVMGLDDAVSQLAIELWRDVPDSAQKQEQVADFYLACGMKDGPRR